MMNSAILIYVTFPSLDEARMIITHLLDQRLIACGNITEPVESHCRWEGKIEKSTEYIVILKTQAFLFQQVQEAILAHHSYDCPCILSWAADANVSFLQWICDQTSPAVRP